VLELATALGRVLFDPFCLLWLVRASLSLFLPTRLNNPNGEHRSLQGLALKIDIDL
jgi:hypothetical protein